MMLGQGRKFCSKLAIDCTIGRQRTPVKDSTKHLNSAKRNQLMCFSGRAKDHGTEPDLADERLGFWLNRSGRSSTSQDAVDG
ncbi:hypothetical protein LINPERHAP2_LOCUS43676 [Linum perenne]